MARVGDPRDGRHPDDPADPADPDAVHRPPRRAPPAPVAGRGRRVDPRRALDGRPHLQGRGRQGAARVGVDRAGAGLGEEGGLRREPQGPCGRQALRRRGLRELPHLQRRTAGYLGAPDLTRRGREEQGHRLPDLAPQVPRCGARLALAPPPNDVRLYPQRRPGSGPLRCREARKSDKGTCAVQYSRRGPRHRLGSATGRRQRTAGPRSAHSPLSLRRDRVSSCSSAAARSCKNCKHSRGRPASKRACILPASSGIPVPMWMRWTSSPSPSPRARCRLRYSKRWREEWPP